MDRRARYERLLSEDQEVEINAALNEESHPDVAISLSMVVPPEYHTTEQSDADGAWAAPPPDSSAPPEYDVATALPSYDDVQKQKEEESAQGPSHMPNDCSEALPLHPSSVADPVLGTDLMFFFTFMIAFLFNWIGLLFSICISQTIAGRYGALSGFGLSLVKWTLIVKHSTDLAEGNYWFWWLLMLCGFAIFFRGSTQYLRIKHQWNRLTEHTREQYIYLY